MGGMSGPVASGLARAPEEARASAWGSSLVVAEDQPQEGLARSCSIFLGANENERGTWAVPEAA